MPHQSSSLPSLLPQAFLNFLFLSESLSLLLLTLLAHYLQGWRLNKKPPSRKSLFSRGWNLEPKILGVTWLTQVTSANTGLEERSL